MQAAVFPRQSTTLGKSSQYSIHLMLSYFMAGIHYHYSWLRCIDVKNLFKQLA